MIDGPTKLSSSCPKPRNYNKNWPNVENQCVIIMESIAEISMSFRMSSGQKVKGYCFWEKSPNIADHLISSIRFVNILTQKRFNTAIDNANFGTFASENRKVEIPQGHLQSMYSGENAPDMQNTNIALYRVSWYEYKTSQDITQHNW